MENRRNPGTGEKEGMDKMTDEEIKSLLERIKKSQKTPSECSDKEDCYTCALEKGFKKLAEQRYLAFMKALPSVEEIEKILLQIGGDYVKDKAQAIRQRLEKGA